jgi:ATP-binding cassette subfamily B protein
MAESDATERPTSTSLHPLRALAPFLRPYMGTLGLALIALVIAGGAMLALPVALRLVIDQGFSVQDAVMIDRYFVWLFVVAVFFGAFSALRYYLVTWLGERVIADIRDTVYRHVLRMDPLFFEVTQTGEVLSRLTTDTTLIQSISGVGISITLRSLLTLVGGLIMLAVTSPSLMGLVVLLVPAIGFPLILIGRRVRGLSRVSQDRIADSSGLAGETLNAIQTVQAFTLEQLQGERFAETVQASFAAAVRRIRMVTLMTAVAFVSLFSAIILVLWRGSHAVLNGIMTGGELGQFLFYAMFVAGAAAALSEMWGQIQRAAGATERLSELLSAEPAIVAPKNPVPLPQAGQGRLRFRDVSFCYPSRPNMPALDRFTLDIRPGETVAFVGPSGAGKTTTFQLLLRFYDPQSGQVEIDGIDIAQADPAQIRQRIGLVPQETVIFGTTARENIRYGRPDASDAEIQAAARAAAADDFIQALPDGYETFLGERGTRLSGGQRQRLAIARAILKAPPILLLDEATSALDAESERLVQNALEQLMKDRTTIIIAHRLATVLKADRIVVMDQGQIVDVGRHHELVERDSLYARLARLQFGVGLQEMQPIAPGGLPGADAERNLSIQ